MICTPPLFCVPASSAFVALRVAGVEHGDRVGLFGFGASAHLAIAVLRAWRVRSICLDPGRLSSPAGGIARRNLGRKRNREAAR